MSRGLFVQPSTFKIELIQDDGITGRFDVTVWG